MRRWVGRAVRALLVLILVAVGAFLVWRVPLWQLAGRLEYLPRREAVALENELRQTLLLAAGALVVLAVLALSWRRSRAAESALLAAAQALSHADEDRRSERFSRALEGLASDKSELRLGSIYVLERLAGESPRDHWPIMEVLSAYVRQRAPWREDAPPPERPPADVQAVLTVLGRRERAHEDEHQVVDLRGVDLRGADLREIHLERARLCEAHLEGAALERAQLEEADLRGAFLSGADLVEANLNAANLREAHLEAAYLVEAHLENTDLGGAHLEGAYLGGAFLEGADLGGAHLDGAYIYKAHLNGASLHGAHVVSAIGMPRRQRHEINRTTAAADSPSRPVRRPRRARPFPDEGEGGGGESISGLGA